MQRLAIACIAAFAVLGSIGAPSAQMRGGSQAGGGGFHRRGEFHDDDFHGHSHGGFVIGAPIIFGPGYYPYGYSYPYGDAPSAFYGNPDAADVEPQDSDSNYWYCGNPAGYYPAVQTCPSGRLQVVPNR
jgi:hypothetical protein